MFTQIRMGARRSLAALTAVVLFAGVTVAGAAMPAAAEVAPTATADPVLTVTPGVIEDVTKEVTLTVNGTGYVGDGAASGVYILVGGLDIWTPGEGPLIAEGWAAQGWVQARQIQDGAFTTTVKVPANSLEAGQTYQVASSAAHGLSVTNRTLDAQVKFTTKAEEPPEPEIPTFDPKFTVSKTSQLSRDGETVTVTGSGYNPAQKIYVALCSDLALPANVFNHLTKCQGGAAQVTPAADGTFTQVVNVKYSDLLADGAAIFTAANHTAMQDRSFDAKVVVSFAAEVVEPEVPEVPAFDPKLTVSKTSQLSRDGETVTVAGSGYNPAQTIYVALCSDLALPGNVFAHLSAGCTVGAQQITPDADGNFTTQFPVVFAEKYADGAAIFTAANHTAMQDRRSDAKVAISFAAGVVEPEEPVEPEVPTFDPKLTVSKTSQLSRDGETVTVTGSGYNPGQKIYVALCSDLALPANVFNHLTKCQAGAAQVTPAADGTFTQVVNVKYSDLLADGAAIFTAANHTAMQDRSFDAKVVVSFADAVGPVDPKPEPKPEPAPTPKPGDDDKMRVGNLLWGIDKTFVDYIPGPIAKGSIKLSDNAGVKNGIFEFQQEGEATAGRGTANYLGGVAFSGHNGKLDSRISNLGLKFIGASKAELTGTVTANSMAGEPLLKNQNVTIATVNLKASVKNKDGSVTYSSNGVTLTADGAKTFGNYYPAGQRVSELTFTVGVGADKNTKPPVVEKPGNTDKPRNETPIKETPAVTAPEVTAKQPEVCVARAVSGATMNWNFKSSFVKYVGGLSDGKISASGVTQGNGFTWAGGSGKYNEAASKGQINFGGTVQFSGHAGVMNAKFSNMRVQFLGANSAALVADVVSNDMNGKAITLNGTQIATISLDGKKATSGSTVTWTNAPVTLTAAGAKAFGGFYNAGEALDPITVSATLGANTNCDTSTGTLAATGLSERTTGVVGIAIAFLAAGAAVLVVGNRRKLAPVRK